MAKTYQDTFTRGAAALAASTSSDGLFTWAVPDGTAPSTNGTAISASLAYTARASADCDTDSTYVEIDITFPTSPAAFWLNVGCNATYPGAGSNGYECALFGGNAQIFAIASGVFTQLGATVAHTPSAGMYRAERNGSTITLYKDGVSVISRTDSSEPTGAGNRRGGLGTDGGGATTQVIGEFRYGDIGGGGGGVGTEGWPKVRQSMRPARFKPMGDGFRPNKYRGWR